MNENQKNGLAPERATATGGASPKALVRLLDHPSEHPKDDERVVIVTGEGMGSQAHLNLPWAQGLFKPKRRLAIKSSMRDTGPNVVSWRVLSRIREEQPPDGSRLGIEVTAWCPPGSEACFAAFACKHERLQETLDRDIERAFIAALAKTTRGVAGNLSPESERTGPTCSPQDFSRLFRHQLQEHLREGMPLEDYGLEFRFSIALPVLEPAFTGEYCVPLDLKGPMKLVLKSKVLLQIAGPSGLIAFLESGIKDLKGWCEGAVKHVMAHEMFADDVLKFLSDFAAQRVPDIEKKMGGQALLVGYRLKNLISQPQLDNGSVPEAFLFLRNLTVEASGEFDSQDPGIKVPLRYSVHCKLNSLDNPRVRDAIECGRNLKGEIEREIREAITRIVRDRTPDEAFLNFEPTSANDGKGLKTTLCLAMAQTLARYGAMHLEQTKPAPVAAADSPPAAAASPETHRLLDAIDISIRANDVFVLRAALNHLEFHIAASYQSPDHPMLAGARLVGRFRVDASQGGDAPKGRDGKNVRFLAFMRFAHRREDNMELDLEQAAQFIHQATSEYLRSKLCEIGPLAFLEVLRALRRDVAHFAYAEGDSGQSSDLFKRQFEQWANDFCASQYGLGVSLLYCNAELNEQLEKHLRSDADSKLEAWGARRGYLLGRINKIYKQLDDDGGILSDKERQDLLDEVDELQSHLNRSGASQSGAPRLIASQATTSSNDAGLQVEVEAQEVPGRFGQDQPSRASAA